MKVIGAGWGRTGTLSLKHALQTLLGGRCYHDLELFAHPWQVDDWLAAARGNTDTKALRKVTAAYTATVDWPGCAFWYQLYHLNPGSKVVLSYRDPDDWVESFTRTIMPLLESRSPVEMRWDWYEDEIIRGRSLGECLTPNALKFQYLDHVEKVLRSIPRRDLLVHRPEDGWNPLCKFLGVDVPKEPYPSLNDGDMFRQITGEGVLPEQDIRALLDYAVGGTGKEADTCLDTMKKIGWVIPRGV